MNLMKLLNKDYLFQNLKKSKVVLAIFVGLIPILNTIVLIMRLTSSNNHVLSFLDISLINLIGLYIIPVVVSICLFNYVYKRKSVDFINSMPISRKSVFVTNTFLGSIILIWMLLMNTILTFIVCMIWHSPIPIMMLITNFLFYTLVYLFVLSATNLAMTISGNAITQIVVTLLVVFLVPFTSFFTNILYNESGASRVVIECTDEICKQSGYTCHEIDVECQNYLKDNKYRTYGYEKITKDYTTPFDIIENAYYTNDLINRTSIIKMLILTILYIGLGLYLFTKRRMEVCETSFKNIHIHNIVKSLTLIPIVAVFYNLIRYENIPVASLIILIILIYYFIYDLITKKSITNIKLSLVYFVVSMALIIGVYSLIDQSLDEIGEFVYNDTVIKYEDIKEVAISLDYIGKDTKTKVYIDDKELIDLVVKSMLKDDSYEDDGHYISISYKLKNNKEYIDDIDVNTNTYNKIISILEKEEEYLNYYKNINIDEVYALKLAGNLYSGKEAKEYLELIKEKVDNLSLSKFLELQKKYYSNNYYKITMYTYENNDKEEFTISSYMNYDLLNIVINLNNDKLKNVIGNNSLIDYNISYKNAYIEGGYNPDTYVIISANEDLYKFIKDNINDKVNMRDEYITFNVDINFKTYTFTTNKVDEVLDILDKKYKEVVNTDEYNKYYYGYGYLNDYDYDSTKEEVIEEYD